MKFYEIFGEKKAKRFQEYYGYKPHLYKKHKEDFEEEMWDECLELANSFHPDDFDEWIASLEKKRLFKYERELYAKVDQHQGKIIISYYILNNYYVQNKEPFMRFIYDPSTSAMYHYREKLFKQVHWGYVLNACDGRLQMGGWTDYDRFYTQNQRQLDDKSIQILRSLPQFKYLPIDLFEKITVYNLFQVNEQAIYQYEILLKSGLIKLATDLQLNRSIITKENFKRFKEEIMNGLRLKGLKGLIQDYEQREKERKERIEKKNQAEAFIKMSKDKFDLGKYILRHPSDFKELQREGRELQHCVANYLDRIVNGETDVLFLRKKDEPGKPFFTVEVMNDTVTQVRTFKNQTNPEITKIVENWHEERMSG